MRAGACGRCARTCIASDLLPHRRLELELLGRDLDVDPRSINRRLLDRRPGNRDVVKIFLTREVALSTQTVLGLPWMFLPSILSQGASSTASSPTSLRSFMAVSWDAGSTSGINKLGTVCDEPPETPARPDGHRQRPLLDLGSDGPPGLGPLGGRIAPDDEAISLILALALALGELVAVEFRPDELRGEGPLHRAPTRLTGEDDGDLPSSLYDLAPA